MNWTWIPVILMVVGIVAALAAPTYMDRRRLRRSREWANHARWIRDCPPMPSVAPLADAHPPCYSGKDPVPPP